MHSLASLRDDASSAPALRPTVSPMPHAPLTPSALPHLRRLALASCLCAAALPAQWVHAQALPQLQNPQLHEKVVPAVAAHAEQVYLEGARLLEHRDFAGAQAHFAEAAKLDPAHAEYGMAFTLTREHRVSEIVQSAAKARLTGDDQQAGALIAEARTIDPASNLVLQHEDYLLAPGTTAASQQNSSVGRVHEEIVSDAAHSQYFAGPIQLKPKPGTQDVDLRGNSRQVAEDLARMFGLRVAFDASIERDANIHLQLDHVTWGQASGVLFKMAHFFAVPLESNSLLVARDTLENRTRLQPLVEEAIYVPASNTEQLNELSNIIKNVFDVQQVAIGAGSGTIAVRATEATLKALNETLEDLIQGASEVILEVKLLDIEKTTTVNTGLQTPTSVGIFSANAEAQSIVSQNSSLVQQLISSGGYVPTGNVAQDTLLEALYLVLSGLVTDAKVSSLVALIGGGLTLAGIDVGSTPTFNLLLSQSDTRVLEDMDIRVGDRQPASLKVGEKYPITTATYSSGVSSATSSALAGVTINGVSASTLLNQYLGNSSALTVPQVQYEDLGITLQVLPTVLNSGLVNMNINLKIESLEGESLNSIPILSSQVFSSDITVKDGVSALMLSQLSSTEQSSIAGLPGLAELPGFSQSAADTLKETDHTELLLLVTPHIVRHRRDLAASRRVPFVPTQPIEF